MIAKAQIRRLFPGLLAALMLALVPGCGGGGSDDSAKNPSSSSSSGGTTQTTLETNKAAVQEMFALGQRALGLGSTPLVGLGLAYPTRDRTRNLLAQQTGPVQNMPIQVPVPGGTLSGTVSGSQLDFTAQVSGNVQVGPSAAQSATVTVVHVPDRDTVTYRQGGTNLTYVLQPGGVTASGTLVIDSRQWTLTEFQQTVTRAARIGTRAIALAHVTTSTNITSDRGERIQWSLDSVPQADGSLAQVTTAVYTQATGASIKSSETLSFMPVAQGSTEQPKPNGKIAFEATSGGKKLQSEVAVENGQPTVGGVFEDGVKIGRVAFIDGKWEFRVVDTAGTASTTVAFDVELDTELLASSMAAVF